MPTYEYVCTSCGHEMEAFQSMKDDPLRRCPKCRRLKLSRKIGGGAGLIFKGSGFYETDYKPRPKSDSDAGGSTGADSSGDSGGGKAREIKKADSGEKKTSSKAGSEK